LTEVHPAYRFAFRVDQLAVDGVLKARFVDAPRLSTLNGDLTSGDNRFKGVIASWVSGEKVHPQSQIYALTPEISIQTAIRGEAKSVVEIVLLNGSKTMYTATLMQTAPLVRTKSDIVLGTALIKAGATFKLTIPTQLQKGSVIMTGEYQSGDNTLRKISAVIAIWEP
jgi:hypothetical protein